MKLPFTLKQLLILKAIASEKNFTKAADLLFMSQPTLSKQIKILENQLEILLINRENNKIKLTHNGKIFLKYSERILSLCEESCRILNDIKNNYRENIIIGTDKVIGNLIVTRIITLFIKNYPRFNIKIYINASKIITQKLLHKELNIAILTSLLFNNQNKKINVKNIINDKFLLIVSNYNLSLIKPNNLTIFQQLLNINFITLNSTDKIYKLTKKYIIKKFKNLLELNSIHSIKLAINLGFGFSFISTTIIKKEKKLKVIKLFKIKNIRLHRTLYILTNYRNNDSKLVEFFIHKLYNLKKNKTLSRSKIFD